MDVRKIWTIARYSLIRTVRDRRALILLLLMPLVLTGILGTALNKAMGYEDLKPFPVWVVSEDSPAKPPLPPGAPASAADALPSVHLGQIFIDRVLGDSQVKKIVETRQTLDLAAARAAVAEGKAVAAIHIPSGFSKAVLAGEPAAVDLITDPGQPEKAAIVEQIVRSFSDGVTATRLGAKVPSPQIDLKTTPSGARPVSAVQYYAAAMAVMFMLMTALARAKTILEERQSGTLPRILTSPTSRGEVLAGTALGIAVVLLAQFLVLMIGTRILYGVDWGDWGAALILAAGFCLAATGVGLLAASLIQDVKAADAAVGLVGPLFAALSGGMAPLYAFKGLLKAAAHLIPNYWALQGFLDQMSGLGTAWLSVGVLAAIGIAAGAIGTWRLAAR
jgi:ABC-2 type transport system permease protein